LKFSTQGCNNLVVCFGEHTVLLFSAYQRIIELCFSSEKIQQELKLSPKKHQQETHYEK